MHFAVDDGFFSSNFSIALATPSHFKFTLLLKWVAHFKIVELIFFPSFLVRYFSSSSLYRFPLVSSIRSLSSMRRTFYERNFPNENKTWANKMCFGEKRFRYTFLRMNENTSKLLNKKFDVVQGERIVKDGEEKKLQRFAKLDVRSFSFILFFSVPINVVLEMEAVWNSNWALTVLHSINYCLSQIFMYQTNRACIWVCL